MTTTDSNNLWIDLLEYREHFPDSGTIKIHHCKTGRHNNRLYLTRTPERKVIAYCFHCGGRGVYTPDAGERRTLASATPPPPPLRMDSFKSWNVPPLSEWHKSDRWSTPEWEKIPLDIRRWWFLAGLNVSEYKDLGVKLLDRKMPAIPLCKNKSLDGVTGLAVRTFDENNPKWILFGERVNAPFTQLANCSDVLVLVEDFLSAMRVSRLAGALPLLGTSLSSEQFKLVTGWWRKGRRVLVWLDNDSPQVIHRAKELYERLALVVDCGIVLTPIEPKHFKNDTQIEGVIHNNGN